MSIHIIMVFILVFVFLLNGLFSTSVSIISISNVYLLMVTWKYPWIFSVILLMVMRLYI
jgi:hypothetical protein